MRDRSGTERLAVEHAAHAVRQLRTRFWICLALTLALLAVVVAASRAPTASTAARLAPWLELGIVSAIYLYGGWPFLTGFLAEMRARRPGMMTLVTVATTVAYGYSAATVLGAPGDALFLELATLVDVMLLGHWIEMRSVGEASSAVESLARLLPARAHRLDGSGAIADVAVDTLVPGEVVLVRPGESVPADGEVVAGVSALDESLLTGESTPTEMHAGDEVIGGAVNGEGALEVRVGRVGADAFLAQVAALVARAQESRSATQVLADRAAMWLTLIALLGGVGTFAVWLALGAGTGYAVQRAVSVMVIACPHALGLAIPLVIAVSTATAARRGILIHDRAAFERLRAVRTVAFDKTGTLTFGRFGVVEVRAFGGVSERDVLALAASLESRSEHPIGSAIVAEARGRSSGYEVASVDGFRAQPGAGVFGRVGGHEVAVVSSRYLAETGATAPMEASDLEAGGRTAVWVLRGGHVEGAIVLADIARPEASAAVGELAALGIDSVMLTGDSERVARPLADAVGIAQVRAGITPAEKAAAVGELSRAGAVAMVGDGVNDAPALAAADVGLAIGAGTDVARAASSVVLVRSDPRDVVRAVELSRATYRKMQENLAWATGYNVIAIPLAAGVLAGFGVVLSPAAGAALMSASTVIVALNASRLHVRGEGDSDA